jgi:hypothetical protein
VAYFAPSGDLGDLLETLGSLEHNVLQIHHRLESSVSEAESKLGGTVLFISPMLAREA